MCKGKGQIAATLGMRLRAFRKAKGVNIADVALATDVSPTQISAIEGDKAKNPALKTVVLLAKYYKTTVDELVADNGDS